MARIRCIRRSHAASEAARRGTPFSKAQPLKRPWGGEANVATALARFGLSTAFVSVIPPNAIGDACVGELRRHGIDTSFVVRKAGRLGIYFLEGGANQRPSVVIYDRAGSAIAEGAYGRHRLGEGTCRRHMVSHHGHYPCDLPQRRRVSLEAVQKARKKGVTVSCDLNYRKNLWKYGKTAPEVMGGS